MRAQIEIFEEAFKDNCVGCRRTCKCGKTYFNDEAGWDFDPGEIEALRTDKNATSIPHSVGTLTFSGSEYVRDCKCWISEAEKIANWIDMHGNQIAEYLNATKKEYEDHAKSLTQVV